MNRLASFLALAFLAFAGVAQGQTISGGGAGITSTTGDCTTTGTGAAAITCTKTNGTSFGPAATVATTTGSGSVVLATSPTLTTPSLGVASGTSLALGGATIGTDALGVTGTATISGQITTSAGATLGSASFLTFNGRSQIKSPGDGQIQFGNNASTNTALITIPATGTIQHGGADAASPVAQTIKFQDVVAGTSNTAGPNATIQAPAGTGTGGGGSLIFQTAPAGSTGTAKNAWTTALTINSAGQTLVSDGSSSAPALGFASSTSTGIWTPLTGAIGFGSSGESFRSEGSLGLGMKSGSLLWWTSSSTLGTYSSRDLVLRRAGAANVALGNVDAASPVAQTISVQNVVAGTADTVGANFTIQGSRGTGTGTGGAIMFYTAPSSTSGSTQNALALAMQIDGQGVVSFPSGNGVVASGGYRVTSNTSDIRFGSATDAKMGWAATAAIRIGGPPIATPTAQTLVVGESSRSGTDTNVAGANGTIQSGNGTGNATPSSLIFQTPVAVASGTGAQTMTTGLTIKNGVPVRPSYAVASLPACSAGTQGGMAMATDSNATLTAGIGAVVANGGANIVPVSCDGTNWRIG